MQLAERVFEHVFAPHVNREVVASDSFVESFELLSEEPTFDVKVEDARVIHEDRKRSISEVDGGLTEYLVQDCSVFLCKQQQQQNDKFKVREIYTDKNKLN